LISSIGSISTDLSLSVASYQRAASITKSKSSQRRQPIRNLSPVAPTSKPELNSGPSRASLRRFAARVFAIEAKTIANELEAATGKTVSKQQSDALLQAISHDQGENLERVIDDVARQLLEGQTSTSDADSDAKRIAKQIRPVMDRKRKGNPGLQPGDGRHARDVEGSQLDSSSEQLDQLLASLGRMADESRRSLTSDLSKNNEYGETLNSGLLVDFYA
jgi:hypothetical protein